MATLKINDVFKITNRGQVLAGEILDGVINAGDIIQLPTSDAKATVKINSIEFINSRTTSSNVGIMVGEANIDGKEIVGKTVIIISN